MLVTTASAPYSLTLLMTIRNVHPIAYISRTLSSAERHYSQLEKEALAIVFCSHDISSLLVGPSFCDRVGPPASKTLLGESNRIPQMASSSIVRWAIFLSAYTYTIRYKPGKLLSNADALSRLWSIVFLPLLLQ